MININLKRRCIIIPDDDNDDEDDNDDDINDVTYIFFRVCAIVCISL